LQIKKVALYAVCLALLTGLGVSGAWGYTINDTTQALAYYKTAPSTYSGWTGWFDVIGTAADFDTKGADISGSQLTIFTNWGPARDGDLGVITADLFIDKGCDGSIDYAVGLDQNVNGQGQDRLGNVYNINGDSTRYSTSYDLFKANGSVVYGGKYDEGDPKLVPVLATTSDMGNSIYAEWFHLGDGANPDYKVVIDLSSLSLGSDWCFVWGTGTCANDTFAGAVPLPPSLLLLGSGLLGVCLLRGRKLFQTLA
jgi:hypothetical protein